MIGARWGVVGCCCPYPATLLALLVPIVLADRERRFGCAVVESDPLRAIAVDHVVAPATIAKRLECEEVANDVAADADFGVGYVAEGGVTVGGAGTIRDGLLAFAALGYGCSGDS